MNEMELLKIFFKEHRLSIGIVLVLNFISVIASLAIPFLVGQYFVPEVTKEGADKNHLFSLKILGFLLVIFLFVYVFQGCVRYVFGRLGVELVNRVRLLLVQRIFSLSLKNLRKNNSGDYASRIANDAGKIGDFFTSIIPTFITDGLTLVGSVVMLCLIDLKLALIMLIIGVGVATVLALVGHRMENLSECNQKNLGDFSGFFTQRIRNMALIKAENKEKFEIANATTYLGNVVENSSKMVLIVAVLSPVLSLLVMFSVIFVVFLGVQEVTSGKLTIGALVMFVLYLLEVVSPLVSLGTAYADVAVVKGAASRIVDVLNVEPVMDESRSLSLSSHSRNSLTIENLSFSYNQEDKVLDCLNLKLEGPGFFAFVGPSGVGKTTIFHLLLQLLEDYEGDICWNGQNLRYVTRESIARHFAFVPQNPKLYFASLKENIIGNCDYDEELFWGVVERVGLSALVDSLGERENTVVNEDGLNFSGGELLRLSLARALYQRPQVLLLDEVTSGLDGDSERTVLKVISDFKEEGMVIFISHKISSISNADCIYLLDSLGFISFAGTHRRLLVDSPEYQRYVALQSSGNDDEEN